MKRVHTMQLTGAGSKKSLTRGLLNLDKGKKMTGMRCKFTVPIHNTTGGALATGLSDAQRQVLFGLFTFWLNYGKDGVLKPFDALTMARIHRIARFCLGSEIEGYTDTTTGLMRNLPDAAITNVVFYMFVPTGYLWMLQAADARLFGMGRSQAKTLQLEIQQDGTAIAAGIAIDGNVSVELFPQTESTKGDPVGAVPFWRQNDTANDEVEGPEGLPLLVTERTAIHTASALTSINVKIDDEVIHEAVSPQDTITEYNDVAAATAAGSITDRETVLYAVAPGAALAELPTGKPTVKQVVKNLATFLAGYLYLPVIEQKDVKGILQVATSVTGRGKELKAAGLRVVRGARGPNRLDAVLGFVLLDRDDREWEEFPGWALAPGESEPRLQVPDGLRARLKRVVDGHKGEGENKAASEVVKQLAAAVPGAVTSARGFAKGGSDVLNRIAQLF